MSPTLPASSQDGPIISDKLTTIHHYQVENLPPWLHDGLFSLINESFDRNGFKRKRLHYPEQLRDELGKGSFLYALTSQNDTGPETVICSCSARPFTGLVKPGSRFDRGPISTSKDETIWELKFLVTLPSMQGRGLASLLLSLVERELVRMAKSSTGIKKLRIVLSTIVGNVSAFYLARGWTLTEERHVPESDLGPPFSVAFMDKVIILD